MCQITFLGWDEPHLAPLPSNSSHGAKLVTVAAGAAGASLGKWTFESVFSSNSWHEI